mmetsp:Transcript_2932/g.7163  ORF Transcript_2932/g.7163 Transcript_2932/m.7163 type:complete len:536 (-) Transcript_2932:245-1852(-)|eukprot:CAMPEP_0177661126 /NCGR_PEP_ID=MMETSP0447-20121125/18478_1 /TAXON_ID=0 /ORGANISM="Stygamoeba regulata, Strain BSH-02190019" /LENGTH=535 /DNA_ID=CAMNT_0019166379 /DNA_START=263 /DNA_END=1870 /DNA_ORIENTATION=-
MAVQLAAAVLLSVLVHAGALQCVPFAGEPDFCAPFLDFVKDLRTPAYLVALPDGASLNASVQLARDSFPSSIRVAPSECRKSVVQFLCLSIFPACTALAPDVSSAQPVCAAACQAVKGTCGDLAGDTLPDCGAYPTGPTTVVLNSTIAALNGSVALLPCVGSGALPARAPSSCPNAFAYDRELDQCVPACPLVNTELSHDERMVLYWVRLGVSGLSIVLLSLHLLTFLWLKEHRRFPVSLVSVFVAFQLTNHIGFVLTDSADVDDFCCESDTVDRNKSDLATAQAVVSLLGSFGSFGTLAPLSLWYVFIVALSGQHMGVVESPIAVAVTYGWIVVVVIAPMAAMGAKGWFGYIATSVGLSAVGDEEDPGAPLAVLFSILTALLTIAIFCVLLVIFFLLKHHMRLYGEMKAAMTRAFSDYWRLLLVLIGVCLVFTYAMMFGWWQYEITRGLIDDATKFYKCNVEGGKDCEYIDSPPFAVILIQWIILPSIGVYIFICFHTGRIMRMWWYILVTKGKLCTTTAELHTHSSSGSFGTG